MNDKFLFSIIIPVKNEGFLLGRCLESIQKIDYPKEYIEVIIADGLSSDNTQEIASGFGARIIKNVKQVVVSGRNCGFREAKGEAIVFTDADCLFDTDWLKNSIKYFSDEKVGGVGGPTLMPVNSTSFEKAVDFIFYLAGAFQLTAHRKNIPLAKPVNDIPGCNAIYRREALEKVMPVDENFLTAEDVWMNFCIRESGYKLIFAPDVILWHHRRSSVRGLWRQVYRFAIGRLQVGKRNITLLAPAHVLAGLGIPLIITITISSYFYGMVAAFLAFTAVFLVLAMLRCFLKTRSFEAVLNLPLAMTIFIFAWSAGFLRELFFPLKDIGGK